MVQRSSWRKIALGYFLFGCAIVAIAACIRSGSEEVTGYSAHGHALDLAVLDGIVAADANTALPAGYAKAAIVPHHLVASKSIALGIKSLATTSLKTVVLISPDHFAQCPTMLCTTEGSYDTFFGTVEIADGDVERLQRKSGLVTASELFKDEHGIFTAVPFIKRYAPDARIIPIVVSQDTRGSESMRAEIMALLEPLVSREDTALVVSSDFSHYLPYTETVAKDVLTQNAFCSGDSDKILRLENPAQSDCPVCLWLMEQQAKKLGFWNPTMLAHTNSAELMRDLSAKEITSHYAFALSFENSSKGSCPVTADRIRMDDR